MGNTTKTRKDTIRCENCGEDYSITYRRCPFCNAKPSASLKEERAQAKHRAEEAQRDSHAASRGGKRLASGSGEGGGGKKVWRIVIYILSLCVVAAAIWIIVTQVVPKFQSIGGGPDDPTIESASPAPGGTPTGDPDPVESSDPDPVESGDPNTQPDPTPSTEPTPTPTTEATPTPEQPRLSSTDFTIGGLYPDPVLLTVRDTTAAVVSWTSSNTAVATVSQRGLVTAVANGVCTVTATLDNGVTLECTVRVSNFTSTATPAVTTTPDADPGDEGGEDVTPTLSSVDFTLSETYGLSYRIRVSGGTPVSWRSSNTAVATVSDDGTVTAVGRGSCVVTVTLEDGTTLSCDVRVNL